MKTSLEKHQEQVKQWETIIEQEYYLRTRHELTSKTKSLNELVTINEQILILYGVNLKKDQVYF